MGRECLTEGVIDGLIFLPEDQNAVSLSGAHSFFTKILSFNVVLFSRVTKMN